MLKTILKHNHNVTGDKLRVVSKQMLSVDCGTYILCLVKMVKSEPGKSAKLFIYH